MLEILSTLPQRSIKICSPSSFSIRTFVPILPLKFAPSKIVSFENPRSFYDALRKLNLTNQHSNRVYGLDLNSQGPYASQSPACSLVLFSFLPSLFPTISNVALMSSQSGGTLESFCPIYNLSIGLQLSLERK